MKLKGKKKASKVDTDTPKQSSTKNSNTKQSSTKQSSSTSKTSPSKSKGTTSSPSKTTKTSKSKTSSPSKSKTSSPSKSPGKKMLKKSLKKKGAKKTEEDCVVVEVVPYEVLKDKILQEQEEYHKARNERIDAANEAQFSNVIPAKVHSGGILPDDTNCKVSEFSIHCKEWHRLIDSCTSKQHLIIKFQRSVHYWKGKVDSIQYLKYMEKQYMYRLYIESIVQTAVKKIAPMQLDRILESPIEQRYTIDGVPVLLRTCISLSH